MSIHRHFDSDAEELKLYGLKEPQLAHYYEPDPVGLFIAESPTVVERALRAGYEPRSILIDEVSLAGNGREAVRMCQEMEERKGREIPVYVMQVREMEHLTGYHLTRGILGCFRRKPLPPPEPVLQNTNRIAVLYDVENPANVGAIFRSAAALFIDAVLLAGHSADPMQRRAIRVGVGTVFQIPWTVLPAGEEMELLRAAGFRTAAMALREDAGSVSDPVLKQAGKLAVLLGNEGSGLPDPILSACDCAVRIPMRDGVDSLNVAAASAVAFWELAAGRQGKMLSRNVQKG